ncbi:serine/threonine protein kinase, partial [Anaeromyxobacter sp. Red801]
PARHRRRAAGAGPRAGRGDPPPHRGGHAPPARAPAGAQGAPAAGGATPAAAPHAAAAAVPFTVHVRPYAQRALLDGVEVAHDQQLVRFELAPGPHVIQVEHACCSPFVRRISAEEAARQGELRVPLEPRPARLRVEGDPATRVYLDGRLVGTAGESQRAPFLVAVPAGGESPYEAPARILLDLAGAPARTLDVKLRAGGEVTVAATQAQESP